MRRAIRAALAGIALAIGGCASTPEATPGRDAEAKEFRPAPGESATLYVYRDDFPGTPTSEDSVLIVNDRMIGATLPGTYFRVSVPPGELTLYGIGHDQGTLPLRVGPGETVFVALNVIDGTSYFDPVPPARGKREIRRCCSLLENWEPGQRPLLR